MKSFPATPLRFAVLVFLLPVSSCSFFNSVGDAVADGYQNTVSYFNSFYNAKRLFDEAEAEIVAAERAAGINGFSVKPVTPPVSARQKLSAVIEKCSNILQFYPTSALVDDALLLIGKSYYYQIEYLRAERKFTEFLSRYPESSLNGEVQLWFIRTLVRLDRDDEALALAAVLEAQAKNGGDLKIAAALHDVLGIVAVRSQSYQQAIEEYAEIAALTSDEEFLAWSHFRRGEELVRLERFEEAMGAFRLAAEGTDNNQMKYQAMLGEIRSLRKMGKTDEALQVNRTMLDNYQFIQKVKDLTFERGMTFAAAGDWDEAVADFRQVDTTAGRSELGAKAAFELGKIYESAFGDYRGARDFYARAGAYPVPDIINIARSRQSAFTRYFYLSDARVRVDSVANHFSGSLGAAADSATPAETMKRIDSLQALLRLNSYELGELFYMDIEQPDSAVFWYNDAIAGFEDSVRTPRMLYILAELARSYPEKNYADPDSLFRAIMNMYPKSVYAMRAATQLGIPVEMPKSDQGEARYKIAEAKIESGAYDEAVRILKTIIAEHSTSPYAPKSSYALGWLYEHRLAQPDSALRQYTSLLESYASSSYAGVVRPRIRAMQSADSVAVPSRRPVDERPENESDRKNQEQSVRMRKE